MKRAFAVIISIVMLLCSCSEQCVQCEQRQYCYTSTEVAYCYQLYVGEFPNNICYPTLEEAQMSRSISIEEGYNTDDITMDTVSIKEHCYYSLSEAARARRNAIIPGTTVSEIQSDLLDKQDLCSSDEEEIEGFINEKENANYSCQ
jgi:hypothetical protein